MRWRLYNDRTTNHILPTLRNLVKWVSWVCGLVKGLLGMSLLHVSCKLFFTFLTNTLKRLERQCTDSGECHFPFVYKGRTYKSCIESTIGLADWCSLTAEYDDEWDRCDKSCPCAFYFDVVPARTIVGSIKFPYVPGDSITYSCQAGYNMMRPATIVCQNTGKWSSNPPSCVWTCYQLYCLSLWLSIKPQTLKTVSNGIVVMINDLLVMKDFYTDFVCYSLVHWHGMVSWRLCI